MSAIRSKHDTFNDVIDQLTSTTFDDADAIAFKMAYAAFGDNVGRIVALIVHIRRERSWAQVSGAPSAHEDPHTFFGSETEYYVAFQREMLAAYDALPGEGASGTWLVRCALHPAFQVKKLRTTTDREFLIKAMLRWGQDAARLKRALAILDVIDAKSDGIALVDKWHSGSDDELLEHLKANIGEFFGTVSANAPRLEF